MDLEETGDSGKLVESVYHSLEARDTVVDLLTNGDWQAETMPVGQFHLLLGGDHG